METVTKILAYPLRLCRRVLSSKTSSQLTWLETVIKNLSSLMAKQQPQSVYMGSNPMIVPIFKNKGVNLMKIFKSFLICLGLFGCSAPVTDEVVENKQEAVTTYSMTVNSNGDRSSVVVFYDPLTKRQKTPVVITVPGNPNPQVNKHWFTDPVTNQVIFYADVVASGFTASPLPNHVNIDNVFCQAIQGTAHVPCILFLNSTP